MTADLECEEPERVPPESCEFATESPEETQSIAKQLGHLLQPGIVVALTGCLGAGKTHFVKGLALGTGFDDVRKVTSPTFTLIHEYPGRCPLYHIDAYRLDSADALEALGFEELPDDGAVVVEWANRVTEIMPPDCLWIELRVLQETHRSCCALATGLRSRRYLKGWAAAIR